MEQLLKSALSTASLQAVFGDRVHPVKKPQRGSLPAITFFRVSGQPVTSLEGSDLQNARYQIDLWSKDYDEIHGTVLDDLIAALEASPDFRAVVSTPPIDDYEPDTELYRVTIDFSLWRR